MTEATPPGASLQDHIRTLEKYALLSDLSGMEKPIALLRKEWDILSEDERREVLKLEAIFLSLMHLKTGSA